MFEFTRKVIHETDVNLGRVDRAIREGKTLILMEDVLVRFPKVTGTILSDGGYRAENHRLHVALMTAGSLTEEERLCLRGIIRDLNRRGRKWIDFTLHSEAITSSDPLDRQSPFLSSH